MKIISLFCLALTLALAGCNLSNTNDTPITAAHPELAMVRLNTLILDVKKTTNTSWQTLLPDWTPKGVITVVKGNASEVRNKLASSANVSTILSNSTSTTNMNPVPFSVHETDPAGSGINTGGIDMIVIPGFRHTEGPLTLSVDLNVQDTRGSFSLYKFLSLRPDQSMLAARAIDENTLQVILITPEIISGEQP